MLLSHTILLRPKLSGRALQFSRSACLYCLLALLFSAAWWQTAQAAPRWSAKLDGKVRFYQSTELGVLVVGTEKSLYTVDAETGDVLWRRKDARVS